MKYAVDKIENDIVVLENLDNRKIINVNIKCLPVGIKETDILKYENDRFIIDDEEKKSRIDLIKEKMEKLKNLDS